MLPSHCIMSSSRSGNHKPWEAHSVLLRCWRYTPNLCKLITFCSSATHKYLVPPKRKLTELQHFFCWLSNSPGSAVTELFLWDTRRVVFPPPPGGLDQGSVQEVLNVVDAYRLKILLCFFFFFLIFFFFFFVFSPSRRRLARKTYMEMDSTHGKNLSLSLSLFFFFFFLRSLPFSLLQL